VAYLKNGVLNPSKVQDKQYNYNSYIFDLTDSQYTVKNADKSLYIDYVTNNFRDIVTDVGNYFHHHYFRPHNTVGIFHNVNSNSTVEVRNSQFKGVGGRGYQGRGFGNPHFGPYI
jgi:hypothetical protein